MKHLTHILRTISFKAIPGAAIQDVAKELIEYRDYCNPNFASTLFNGKYIEIDSNSTVESIISDYYNGKKYSSEFIEISDVYTSIMRSFQEQCGESYPFKTIIDNLSDKDICDCFLMWMIENGYKKERKLL